MSYKLIPRTIGTVISITSTASGADPLLQASASTTAAWAAGAYTWVGYVINGAERYTLESGSITIEADPGVVTGLDLRSSARKTLDAVNIAMESYGPKAYLHAYEITGRRQQFHTPGEFLAFRSKLMADVAREDNAARISAGLSPRNQMSVRFNT